jgi:hypothetical protein
MSYEKRLTVTVQRDGKSAGLTMLAESPTRFGTFNPYNTFFDPKELDVDGFKNTMCWAKENSGAQHEWPQHGLLLMAQWFTSPQIELSFPECGTLPAVQKAMMYFIAKTVADNPSLVVRIRTLSEYMIRALQVVVARGVLNANEVTILDQDNSFNQAPIEYES